MVLKYFRKFLNNYRNNSKFNQVFRLFAVNLITIPIGVVTSIFLTRFLGSEDYGNYNFIASIFQFAIILFTFGFLQASNRALVLNHNLTRAKQYYGTTLIILSGIFLLMSAILFIYGYFDDNLREKNIQSLFMWVIPVGSVFLLTRYFETLFQADNRIKLLSQSRLIPKVFFGIVVALMYWFYSDSDFGKLKMVWLVFFVTQLLVYIYILSKVKLSFKNYKNRFSEIWRYNKSFGLNVYLGSLFAVGFSSLTQILIGYFGADNSGVGYYALAVTFSMPLSFIPNTIATTHYKDFAGSKRVPRKLLLITIGLSLLSLIAVWVLVPPFVRYFYGIEYLAVIPINFIVSIGVILYGFGDFFNRFLGANGQGKTLRNASFFVGASLLITSLLLIPNYAEYGAAFAKLIAGFTYLGIIIYYYFKYKIQ